MPKFKNFAARKGVLDRQKNNQFVKLSRQMTVEARNGGADPNGNFKLKSLITKARAINMPVDNIERAITVTMVPKNTVKVTGENAKNMLRMLETFEDNDDVQNVYTNMEIDDEEMEALQG